MGLSEEEIEVAAENSFEILKETMAGYYKVKIILLYAKQQTCNHVLYRVDIWFFVRGYCGFQDFQPALYKV